MICPELHYRKTDKGIMITACFGYDGEVFLPDEIDGVPITAIAPYAFAENEVSEEDEVWINDEALLLSPREHLTASKITMITLPDGIREIGRYAFYRCRNLKKLVLSDGILEIGGGALNGCRIEEVEIYCRRGKRSALKSVLDEIRFEIHAVLHYVMEDGSIETADVLFPEHYEEAVENTPARILYTSHHGAGGYYRQCFYNRELDYKKYDELFFRAVAEGEEETNIRLAAGRLRHPFQLTKKAEKQYERYIREHLNRALLFLVENEDKDMLHFFSERAFFSEEALEKGIDYAALSKKTEILGILMEEKRKLYPKKRKTFDL